MQLTDIFHDQLNEQSSNQCEELFGQYLFGQYEKYYGSVVEPNTEFEQQAFDAFASWIELSGGKRKVNIKYLKELIKCKEQYPKILDPGQTTFYRAFGFMKGPVVEELAKIEMMVNRTNWSDKKWVDKYLNYANCQLDYTPLSIMESWTTSKSSALTFALQAKHIASSPYNRNRHMATFILKSDNDPSHMIFNPRFTAKMGSDTRWGSQNEIIRLSPDKSPIKVQASYVPFLPASSYSNMLGVPKEMKEYVRSVTKAKWQSF